MTHFERTKPHVHVGTIGLSSRRSSRSASLGMRVTLMALAMSSLAPAPITPVPVAGQGYGPVAHPSKKRGKLK
jgi:hypothetical protein